MPKIDIKPYEEELPLWMKPYATKLSIAEKNEIAQEILKELALGKEVIVLLNGEPVKLKYDNS